MREIKIYTDGACRGNPGIGAFGVVFILENGIQEFNGYLGQTTNNRAELTAVISALEFLGEVDNKYKLVIYSDSKYVVDAINKGWLFNWIRKPNFSGKKNEDLWRQFLTQMNNYSNIEFRWVKGHSGDVYNELCDKLANAAIDEFKD